MGITAQKKRGVSLFGHFTAVRSICVFDRSCSPTQFLLLRVQSSPVLPLFSDFRHPEMWRSIDTMRRCQRARGKAVQVIKFCCSALAFNSNFCCCACNPLPFVLLSRIPTYRTLVYVVGLFAGCARAVGLDIQVIEFYFLVCCCMRIQFWFAVRSILTRFASYFRCAVY